MVVVVVVVGAWRWGRMRCGAGHMCWGCALARTCGLRRGDGEGLSWTPDGVRLSSMWRVVG